MLEDNEFRQKLNNISLGTAASFFFSGAAVWVGITSFVTTFVLVPSSYEKAPLGSVVEVGTSALIDL